MNIKSAKFIKGIVAADEILEDGKPQIAIIGRSNAGKSSLINSVTNQKDLAKTSSFPGRTQELNLFLINNSIYLVDLPGYGFAKASGSARERLENLIDWYLFNSDYQQKKVILIIDAGVGPTASDLSMFHCLEEKEKNIIIVANKIDKLKNSEYHKKLRNITELTGGRKIIPYSSTKKIGIKELTNEILN